MAVELAEHGIELVDAPVSGGAKGADAGTIAIMVGASPEQFERLKPVLAAISPNIHHAGSCGAGQVIKLVNNMISGVQRLVTQEGIALASRNGIDPRIACEILLAGGARNAYMEKFMLPHVLEGNVSPGFTLALMVKDMRLANQLANDTNVPSFFGSLARELYQLAMAEMGPHGEVDTTALVMDRLAGTAMVPNQGQVNSS
jgi:3-hydroxyisobutyrate dehydrogenase